MLAERGTVAAMTRRTPQGEALATWALWALVLAAIVVTYARLEPAELYNVSREGLAGGLSRAVVELNFPISLVAIALALVAPARSRTRVVAGRACDRALRRHRVAGASTRTTSTHAG